jgi:hypothetical protein
MKPHPTHRPAPFVLLILVSALVGATPAVAQQPSEREQARQHYQTGAASFERGDYASALVELQQSYELFASLRTLFSIAQCQQALFDYPAAIRSVEQYLREGGADVPANLRAQAETMLADMRRDMAHVTVSVAGVDGAHILVDGAERATSPSTGPIDVGPGAHDVEVRADGYATARRQVTVAAGATESVRVTLERTSPEQATIRIDTGSIAARVFVDGVEVGTTPLDFPVAPGIHPVLVEAEGYRSMTRTAEVTAGGTETVAFELVAETGGTEIEPPPVVEPPPLGDLPPDTAEEDTAGSLWWLWTAIGVVVVGGAVTAGVVLGMEDDTPTWDLRGRMP